MLPEALHNFVLLSLTCVSVFAGRPTAAETAETANVYEPPENGGPRRLEAKIDRLKVYSRPSTGSDVIAEYARGGVFTNLGCAAISGASWCNVAPLGGRAQGFVPAAQVQPAKGPDGLVPTGLDDSRARARDKDFDAAGTVLCAQERGQPVASCNASVARSGGGDASVVVTFPNGFARHLFFTHGAFIKGSATMSGVGTDIDWALKAGVYVIRVDDQQFEISERFVLGN